MNITMTITERDKKLLIFLAVFLLITGALNFIIFPYADKVQTTQSELTDAKMVKADLQQKVTLLAASQNSLEQRKEELQTLQADYYSYGDSDSIDQIFTHMAIDHELLVRSFTLKMPGEGDYANLAYYRAAAEEKGESEISQSVYCAKVSVTLKGSRQNLQAFLDECVSLSPKMRVSGFSWKNTQKGEDNRLTIDAEVYMAESLSEFTEEIAPEETETTSTANSQTQSAEADLP